MVRVGAVQDVLCIGHDPAPILRVGALKGNDVLTRYVEQAEHNVWGCLQVIAADV